MPITLDADGIQIETFSEIFAGLVADFQGIYGSDIDVEQNSPDGQRIGILAAQLLDMQQRMVDLYNANDPGLADGIALHQQMKRSGLFIRPATKSQWDLTITAAFGLTLPDNYTVRDPLGQLWETDGTTALLTGANTVTFFAVEFGALTGLTADVIEPVTIVSGVTAWAAGENALVGSAEETSQEARIRRAKSLENPSFSLLGSIVAKVGQLAGVIDVVAYQNDTDTDDATTGIPKRTVWAIVEGGSVADIAETLAKQKTAGAGWKGDVEQTYVETIVRPTGADFLIPHEVKFDRPTDIPLHIRFTVVSSGAVDTARIKADLVNVGFAIGETAQAGQLYEFVYGGGVGYAVTDLEISDDDSVFTDESITPALNERFEILTANIDITGP